MTAEQKKKKKTNASALLFAALIVLLNQKVRQNSLDTDLLWHYKIGGYIVKHGFPKGDIFSWQKGLGAMYHEWLFDIIAYLNFHNFASPGHLLAMVIPFLTLVIIAYTVNRKAKSWVLLTIWIPYWTFAVSMMNFSGRPADYSMLLLLAEILFLRKEGMSWKKKWILAGILAVINVNIHGGSVVQLIAVPVLYIVCDLISWGVTKHHEKSDMRGLLVTLPVVAGASLLNPYGWGIYKYVLSGFVTDNKMTKYISEWRPFTFPLLIIVIFIGSFILIGMSKKVRGFDRGAIRDLALIAAFFCIGTTSNRFMKYAMVAFMIFGYPYAEETVRAIAARVRSTRKKQPKPYFWKNQNFYAGLATVLCVGAIGFFSFNASANAMSYSAYVRSKEEDFYGMAEYINKNNIAGHRIFNSYSTGSLMIAYDIPDFVDSRCDPFLSFFSKGNSSLNETAVVGSSVFPFQEFNEMNKKYDFEYLLLNRTIGSDARIAVGVERNGGKLLYTSGKYLLYAAPEPVE